MTGLLVTAGFVLAMCVAVPAVWWLRDRNQEAAWRREDDQLATAVRGRHRALKPLPATIPRAKTEHEPPWEPAFQAAPVIEPAAVTHGPPQPEPEPDAIIILAGTYSGGQVRLDRVAVLPPPVQKELGYRTVDEALESMLARAMQVRALTDGAP